MHVLYLEHITFFFFLLSSHVNIEFSIFEGIDVRSEILRKSYMCLCNFTLVIFSRFSLVCFATSVAIVYEQNRDNITRFTRCRFRNNQDQTAVVSDRCAKIESKCGLLVRPQFCFFITFCERKRGKVRERERNVDEAWRLVAYKFVQNCTWQGWNLTSCALLSEEGGRQRGGFYYVFIQVQQTAKIRRIRMDVESSEKEFRAEMYDIGFYVCNNASAPAVRIVCSETRMQPFSSSCLFRRYFSQFRGIDSRESASRSRASCMIFFIVHVYRRFPHFCLREEIDAT